MIGRLLVLEGIDGCGKSTQLSCLANWLPSSGLMPAGSQLVLSREPGGTALGLALRQLLLHPPGEESPEPLAELLLYAADRAQHVDQILRPALERGDWILCDRFSGSTLAYQGYGRQLNHELIIQLEKIATAGLKPDLTLWLNLSVEQSLSRRKMRSQDRIEAEGLDFLVRVAEGFSALARDRNWVDIEADQPQETVSLALQESLQHHLSQSHSVGDGLNDH